MQWRYFLASIQLCVQLCAQLGSAVAPGMEPTIFSADLPEEGFRSWQVLPSNPDEADTQDSVIAHSSEGNVYVSQNLGINWTKVDGIEFVSQIQFSRQDSDKVYVYSGTKSSSNNDASILHLSFDRGISFEKLELPDDLNTKSHVFSDHPVHKNWLIFNSAKASYYSKDRGKTWNLLMDDVLKCYFVAVNKLHYKESSQDDKVQFAPNLVYCVKNNDQTNSKEVYYSQEFFTDAPHKRLDGFDNLQLIEQHGNFVTSVSYDDEKNGKPVLGVSVDGIHFHRAQLPQSISKPETDMRVGDSRKSLTLIEGAQNTLLHTGEEGSEFVPVLNGIIDPLKDLRLYVEDYDLKVGIKGRTGGGSVKRIPSVDGVLLASTISNIYEFENKKKYPVFESHISRDGGATWQHIKGPKGGKLFLAGIENSNGINTYTPDENAVGIYIAYGNEQMDLEDRLSTYMTRDAGASWFKIHDNLQLWAVGDHGSIIIIVNNEIQTDHFLYSIDEGATWNGYSWGYDAVAMSLTASPSISTGRFVLLLHDSKQKKDQMLVVDFFTGGGPFCTDEDFETWIPSQVAGSESDNKCTLGKEVAYLRRIRDRECFIGSYFNVRSTNPVGAINTCDCARKDYECSLTHKLDPTTNTCVPQKGVRIISMEDQCKNGAVSWRNVTGYRRLAASSCKGDFLPVDQWIACPGKDDAFKNQEPVSGLEPPLKPYFKRSSTSISPLLIVVIVALSLLGVGILILLVIFRHSIIRFLRKHASKLPFIKDNLGSYSRMSNEERARALDDDGNDFEIDDDIELDDMSDN